MPRPIVSIPLALERALANDGAVSEPELRALAELPAAKADPAAVLAALEGYQRKMTPTTFDAFNAARASARPLDVLAGRVPTPPALPAWYPPNLDLAAVARSAKDILIGQGERADSFAPGAVDKLVFTDADLTMIKSSTPVIVRNKETGEPLKYPAGHEREGHLVLLGGGPKRSYKLELEALKAGYPQLPWDKYAFDFSEFASLSDILRTEAIPDDLRTLKASDADPMSRDFVITARGSDLVAPYLDEYLLRQGIDSNGVFAVNSPGHAAKLGFEPTLSGARRKAVTMAALIELYGRGSVTQAKFMDDTDENLLAAMQLLPKLFPGIKLSFYDVEEQGADTYRHRMVARTTRDGELVDRAGKKLSIEALETYKSNDAYPIDTRIFGPGGGG